MNTPENSKHRESNLLPLMRAAELRNLFQGHHGKLPEPRRFEKENLSAVNMRGRDLSGCDFIGAVFGVGQDLSRANFTNCIFGPVRDGLMPVSLQKVDLTGAHLPFAQMTGVSLKDSKLIDANLSSADLSSTDCTYADFSYTTLYSANLTEANLFQARFYRTRFSLNKRSILQADAKAWREWCKVHFYGDMKDSVRLEQGAAIYLELKENFRSIGAYSEASWAYIMERRMRRDQHHPLYAHFCFETDYPDNRVLKAVFYVWHSVIWLSDLLVDLTTGYGESLLKPIVTLGICVALVFPLLYNIAGGVTLFPGSAQEHVSREYIDLLLFSTGNLLQGYPGYGSVTELGKIFQLFEQLFGVLMIGLLGFILGNKINLR